MASPDLRACARHGVVLALVLIERLDPAARDLARAAMDDMTTARLQALLDADRASDWRPMLLEALAHAAVAAADDILGDDDA
jgi:hypothetical protein